jgi:hypothetical protein
MGQPSQILLPQPASDAKRPKAPPENNIHQAGVWRD